MSTYILTLVDVRQVQRYVLNANELKQNLGASYLVEQAIRAWIFEALQPYRHNWLDPDKDEFDPALKIEDPGRRTDAEVIFSGGGNTAILFQDFPTAIAFTKRYTRLVLQNAPGLEVAIGHVEIDWGAIDGMKTAWERMQDEMLMRRKEGRITAQPLAGLGVTSECAFTGRPAVDEITDPDGRSVLVSAEAYAKHNQVQLANQRLQDQLPVTPFFEYTSKFDELGGERGRSSYLAVVHADGNGMSKRIKNYSAEVRDSRETVNRMRAFSKSVNRAGLAAMEAVRDWLLESLVWENQAEDRIYDRWSPGDYVRLKDNIVPYRPIVYGGDDVTLVCEGRLGLPLAAKTLEAFASQKLEDDQPIYACAGVAIVHTNYPFARAYALAEDLCRKAKIEARRLDEIASRAALLHWNYTSSGRTLEEWDEIHRQVYIETSGDLTLRPLLVTAGDGIQFESWRTWESFLIELEAFRKVPWAGRRNKVKDLQSALRQGQNAVDKFTSQHELLPAVPGIPAQARANALGWYDGHCLYFDVLEANDMLIYPKERGEQ